MEVRLTIVEDRPVKDQPAIVDDLEDVVEDMRGWLEECLESAAASERGVGRPLDLDLARRSLANCQELFARIEQRFSSGFASYERLDDLNRLGQERRGEWLAWANATRLGIDHCR